MKSRIDISKFNPKAMQMLIGLAQMSEKGGPDATILHLVMMRASQINGCAYCLDMHSKDARAAGEAEQRLYGLDAWREAPYYSDRERAALAWTEAVTLVADTRVPDEAFDEVKRHFTEAEIGNLTLAITSINTFNRLNVAFRTEAGGYRPGMFRNVTAAAG
jgi:AhpD family alkylhydroperoxidase